MTQLENRRVLVTGASSGIGAATVRALRGAGARVAAGARRVDRLDADVPLALDVTDETSVRAAVTATVASLGGLDLVVHAAGIMPVGPVLGADVTDWRRTLDTNVLGLMLVTHAALPHLIEAGAADLVAISSVGGRETFPGAAVYHASKFAVTGFSDSLRKEISTTGVRVSVVEPGFTDTELPASITVGTVRESIEGLMAGQRNLDSADVAASILHIVSQPPHVVVNNLQVRPLAQL